MITLDPEFVGMVAPPSKLTNEIPFARLPREERLKRQNRADETENRSEEEEGEEEGEGDVKDQRREEKEKKKMRGRGKALKRYLRKHRKNVIDPQTVINCSSLLPLP
jgi:U3 small nucleolar RNA-associated protein 7